MAFRCLLLVLLGMALASGYSAAALRIGLLSTASPFIQRGTMVDILSDEITLLFNNDAQVSLQPFATPRAALEALRDQRIDLLVAARPPAASLYASLPLLSFPLAALRIKNGRNRTLCFPEIPQSAALPCTLFGSASPGENVQRLVRDEASEFIAPEFLLRAWLIHAPATALTLAPLSKTPPLRYYAWTTAANEPRLQEMNSRILALNPEKAHWLERKWFLPTGSVFSARNPPDSENKARLALKIELPLAPPPLVQITANGQIRGVWYDLLTNLFPANSFDLTFRLAGAVKPNLLPDNRASLTITARQTRPTPDALPFDTMSWGVLSPRRRPLQGALQTLQHKRLAVWAKSTLSIENHIPAENLVRVKDLEQGVRRVKAGGADGLVGNAFTLNYVLTQLRDPSLQLAPLEIPETPLWFVTHIARPDDDRRVKSILASITPGDLYGWRTQRYPDADVPEKSAHRLWLVMLSIVSLCAVLIAIVAFSSAQLQRRRRERDVGELQNALSLWRTLMNNAPVPLFVCDAGGNLLLWNDAFRHATPRGDGRLKKGVPLFRLPLGELAQQLNLPRRLLRLNSDVPTTGETKLDGDTTVYWWLCRYTDDRGRPQGIVGGWVDISEKAALTLALSDALAQAEFASTEKSNFLARMSHDIRTPLNAVLGLLDMEREKSDSLNIAWQAAGTLRDLIGDILDLSRIEAGELHLDIATHNLFQVLSASAQIFASSAKSKGLHWLCHLDIPQTALFRFDKGRLNQIIANLLGNAIKYTPEGKVMFIAYGGNQQLSLTVTDSGIGIPEEAMPCLGQPWFQINSATPQSSGLGLAICYQLVELMGGTLRIHSQPGKGTSVHVLLPMASAPEGEAPPPAHDTRPPASLPSRRVLIVDDFPANLTVIALQLEKIGQKVTCCDSAHAALAILEREPFDVLLTDCQMPVMDGYQLVRQLLQLDLAGVAHAPPLILGCTASALQEDEQRAAHAGMDGLLRKPLSVHQLRDTLAQSLEKETDVPALEAINQLADGQAEVIALMHSQLREAVVHDLNQLRQAPPSCETLARIAHRLKASWSLLGMQRALRACLVMEMLPTLPADEMPDAARFATLSQRFVMLMQESLTRLEQAQLSDVSEK